MIYFILSAILLFSLIFMVVWKVEYNFDRIFIPDSLRDAFIAFGGLIIFCLFIASIAIGISSVYSLKG